MLDTRFMPKPQAKHMVVLWLQLAERSARDIAMIDSVIDGNYNKHFVEYFSHLADHELAILEKTEQFYAEGLLEGLLTRNPYYQGKRKNEEFID